MSERTYVAAALASSLCFIRKGQVTHQQGMSLLQKSLAQAGISQGLLNDQKVIKAASFIHSKLRDDCLSSTISNEVVVNQVKLLIEEPAK